MARRRARRRRPDDRPCARAATAARIHRRGSRRDRPAHPRASPRPVRGARSAISGESLHACRPVRLVRRPSSSDTSQHPLGRAARPVDAASGRSRPGSSSASGDLRVPRSAQANSRSASRSRCVEPRRASAQVGRAEPPADSASPEGDSEAYARSCRASRRRSPAPTRVAMPSSHGSADAVCGRYRARCANARVKVSARDPAPRRRRSGARRTGKRLEVAVEDHHELVRLVDRRGNGLGIAPHVNLHQVMVGGRRKVHIRALRSALRTATRRRAASARRRARAASSASGSRSGGCARASR